MNFFVYNVLSTGDTLLLPSDYNGLNTYVNCSGSATSSFKLDISTALSNFSQFSIDWGDGSTQTGTLSATSTITHTYSAAALYNVSVQFSTSTGCSIDTVFGLYYGSTQSVGLTTPQQKTNQCLSNGDSATVYFKIDGWQNDPIGLQYTFSSNDGTTKIAYSPLITAGVSNYPFIVDTTWIDPATNVQSTEWCYEHKFRFSSCGYAVNINNQIVDNTFGVSASKEGPCPDSYSIVGGGPIKISESPNAEISANDSICINQYLTVTDYSSSGKFYTPSGCDSTAKGVWEILDINGNTIPSNFYSLQLGSFLGSIPFNNAPPVSWTVGSDDLTLSFSNPGIYMIIRQIGLTSTQAYSLCNIDKDTVIICVDEKPIAFNPLSVVDTVCVNSPIEFKLLEDSINCNSPTTYSIEIKSGNQVVYQSSSQIDTAFSWTPLNSGSYSIELCVENFCGDSCLIYPITVLEQPDVYFPPNDSIICQDTLLVNLGEYPFGVISNSTYAEPDSVYYFITPQTGWTALGINQSGHDSIILWDSKITPYMLEHIINAGAISLTLRFN